MNPAVLAFLRRHPAQTLLGLHNVSRHEQWWPRAALPLPGEAIDALTAAPPEGNAEALRLAPYAALWLVV